MKFDIIFSHEIQDKIFGKYLSMSIRKSLFQLDTLILYSIGFYLSCFSM